MLQESKHLRLVCDVLDALLVDRAGRPMGRADGVAIVIDGNDQPRVAWIETGCPVLARRVGPRIARSFQVIARRCGIQRGRRFRIAWNQIQSIGLQMKLNLDADRTPNLAWEHWLAQRVFWHLPGGKAKE